MGVVIFFEWNGDFFFVGIWRSNWVVVRSRNFDRFDFVLVFGEVGNVNFRISVFGGVVEVGVEDWSLDGSWVGNVFVGDF